MEGVRIRSARPSDLRGLAAVEESGGALFVEHLGDRIVPALLAPAPDGRERAGVPGFLLVAEVRDTAASGRGEVVGFAHVAYVEGWAHLEQLSVRPEHGRHGIGTALVRAALAEARWDGYAAMSLITYRDLPWNGPFYRRLGFAPVPREESFHARLRAHERSLGLDRAGVREVLHRPL